MTPAIITMQIQKDGSSISRSIFGGAMTLGILNFFLVYAVMISISTGLFADQVSKEVLEKEKEVFTAQARESGKPENIIEKMIEGRLKKFLKEICVESQPFVKDPQLSVSQLVENTSKELGVKINFNSFAKFQF